MQQGEFKRLHLVKMSVTFCISIVKHEGHHFPPFFGFDTYDRVA